MLRMTRQGRITTARRPGAAAAISLLKRRTWYTDPKPEDPAKGDDKPEDKGKGDQPETFSREYVDELRKENAKWRTDFRKLEKRIESVEGEKKTDKADTPPEQDGLKTLEKTVKDLQVELARRDAAELRRKVAKEAGLPEEAASRLTGTTEEELQADAAEFKKLIPDAKPEDKPADPKAKPRSTTTPAPDGGQAKETDAQKRARLFHGQGATFEGGGVHYHGDKADLETPLG